MLEIHIFLALLKQQSAVVCDVLERRNMYYDI